MNCSNSASNIFHCIIHYKPTFFNQRLSWIFHYLHLSLLTLPRLVSTCRWSELASWYICMKELVTLCPKTLLGVVVILVLHVKFSYYGVKWSSWHDIFERQACRHVSNCHHLTLAQPTSYKFFASFWHSIYLEYVLTAQQLWMEYHLLPVEFW